MVGVLALVVALVTVVVRVGLVLGLLTYLDVTLLQVSRTMRRRQIVDVRGRAASRARLATEAWMVNRLCLMLALGTTVLAVVVAILAVVVAILRAAVDVVLGVGG